MQKWQCPGHNGTLKTVYANVWIRDILDYNFENWLLPIVVLFGWDRVWKKTNKLSLIFLGYVLNKALLTIVFFDVNREKLIKYYCELYNIDISLPFTILFTSQQNWIDTT